jgi:MoxR-like ATPase
MTIAKESESSANHDTDPVQQSAAFESESARRFEASQLTHETSTQSEHIDELQSAASVIKRLVEAVRCKVLGRDEIIELCVIALLADGHVLLEDFPGSGKTTLAKTLGEAINSQLAKPAEDQQPNPRLADFRRIQFTPDLLPSDVTGVTVFDPTDNGFHFRPGPLFAHVVLADEINRTSPKVQSAMLEAMGEKQITVDNQTYPLGELFFVIATQNPLDLAGTYPLPTPQLDRFLFKLTMEHIDREAELQVLDAHLGLDHNSEQNSQPSQALHQEEVLSARQALRKHVQLAPEIKTALVDISRALRADARVLQGNSTRSMVLLLPALQVAAALGGRSYVSAVDIERLLPRVLAHRLVLAPGAGKAEELLAEVMAAPLEQLARSTLT